MTYAEYRDLKNSGIKWLQDIPSHWRIKRLKFSTELVNDKVSVEESSLPYLGLEHIESWTGRRIFGEIANSEGLASAFSTGDLLFGKLRPYLAKVHLAEQEGLISSEALVIRSKAEVHSAFLKYYMLSRDFINIVDSSTYGSKMPRANWDFIGNLPLLLPELEEQQAIARFLDFKTAQIDALIAKKQALLDKLAEKRTALISHAVTKGLDPLVPMKDSGVAWLGEIPAHWEAKKIKYFAAILRGRFSHRPRNDPRFYGGDYPFIQTGDVANADKYINGFSQTLNEDGLKVSKEFPSGTLVMTIAANIGDMAILNFNACFPDSIVGFVPQDDVSLNYLFYMFTAMRQQLLSTAVLNTQLNLNIERIGDQFGPFPPKIEQDNIAQHLDSVVSKMAEQAACISAAIDRLQEYRSALITNAVTGKIDVRAWQPNQEAA